MTSWWAWTAFTSTCTCSRCQRGFGKLTRVDSIPVHKRGGKGLRVHRVGFETGKLAIASLVPPQGSLMLLSSTGNVVVIPMEQISVQSRNARGVHLMASGAWRHRRVGHVDRRRGDGYRGVGRARRDLDSIEEVRRPMKLVFVHGSGGTGVVWKHQTEFFRDADAVNLPGHLSDGEACTSVEEYAAWLHGYVDLQGLLETGSGRPFARRRYRAAVCAGLP